MKEEKLLLEVINDPAILVNVINCVQKSNIAINEFKAEESAKANGHISMIIEAEKENLNTLIKELEKLEGVEHVSTSKSLLPSSELQNSFEE
jgi:predicted regulator of amino acid metabolism with ACT domain